MINQIPTRLRQRRFQPLPEYQSVFPLAINRYGQAVGFCHFVGSGAWMQIRDRAFLYRRGKMHGLSTLANYEITHAVALNDHGMIVGDATIDSFPTNTNTDSHAVCWINEKVRDLGTGWALAVNNSGIIVGDSGNGPEDHPHDAHALLWTHGCRYDLNDYIRKDTGWVLATAAHIDSHGRITGVGMFQGQPRRFRLTPHQT